MAKPKKRVNQLDSKGKIIATFASRSEAAEKIGVSSMGIYNCATGRQKLTGGFGWEYADEKDRPESKRKGKLPELHPLPTDDDERRMFFCQTCGGKEGPKHKFVICRVCIDKVIKMRGEKGFSDIVFLPVRKGILAETIERALEAFLRGR